MRWMTIGVVMGTSTAGCGRGSAFCVSTTSRSHHAQPTPVRSSSAVPTQRRSSGGVWVARRRRYRGVMGVGGEASTSEATAAVRDELAASLQHLTQPGEEGEEEEGERLSPFSEEELATAPPPPTSAAAVSTESAAAPEQQPRNGGNTNINAVITTVVSDEDNNAPIDWILSRRLPENSRRFYRKALEGGGVKVDGRKVRRLIRVKRGATISVDLGPQNKQQESTAVAASQTPLVFPERLPRLRVVFEDEHLFAIMKPAGMVCQPCAAAPSGTVLHGLMYHMVQTGQIEEGSNMAAAASRLSQGIVQRLDKQTSGIMIIAKTLAASSKLSKLFKKGKVSKQYLAVCHGDPGFDSVVDAPLYRRSSGKVGAVNPWEAADFKAKEARTRVRNVATAAGMSLCRADILTGRMHQVRVHLKWIGCPIVGDKEYGDVEANQRVGRRATSRVDAARPLLHSVSLEFTHPFTNTPMSFKAPMPADMWEAAQNILRVSGTREQQEAFGQLQELRQSNADEAAPVGGRGAPRLAGGGRGGRKKPGNRSKAAKAAFDAVAKSQIFEQ